MSRDARPDDELANEEWFRRHWAEFPHRVAGARAEVYWRRLKRAVLSPFERLLNRLPAALRGTGEADYQREANR